MKGLKFTKQNLDDLKPAEREYFVWSIDLPGFGCRISPSGHRSWVVQFRLAAGRSIRRTIGNVKVVPISIAEPRAQELLAAAKVRKVDLDAEEKADTLARIRRRDTTVGSVARAYLAEPETRAKRSYREIERYLVTVWAGIADVDAEECSRHDLIPTLRKIATERGAVTANRAKACLSACFVWAIRHGVLRRDSTPPTRYLPVLGREAEGAGVVARGARPGLEGRAGGQRDLRRHGQTPDPERLQEVRDRANSRGPEIDLGRAVLEIPGSRTKNSLPLVVPLPPAAVAIMANTPRMSTARCSPGSGAGRTQGTLDDLIGSRRGSIHDIRRSRSAPVCASTWPRTGTWSS